MMTSRERVLTALNHEEPDRVPLFFGTSGVTSILGVGYGKLKAHLGIKSGAPNAAKLRGCCHLNRDLNPLVENGLRLRLRLGSKEELNLAALGGAPHRGG